MNPRALWIWRGAGVARRLAHAATLSAGAALASTACSSPLRPVSAESRLGDRPAAGVVLVLAQPCSTLPGGTPMGRPDGVLRHTLPADRYPARFEDERGVYFASPTGVVVTEPALRGTRTRPGGIWLPRSGLGAWEYLGDAEGVSEREPLPKHCQLSQEAAAPAAPGGG